MRVLSWLSPAHVEGGLALKPAADSVLDPATHGSHRAVDGGMEAAAAVTMVTQDSL